MSQHVCVVGMGYVGLTLAAVLADKGYTVVGVERNSEVVAQLRAAKPHFHEPELPGLMRRLLAKGMLTIETSVPRKHFDVFVIAVGTPLNHDTKKPILDHIIRSAEEVAAIIEDGSLVIYRSTVPIGTTRTIIKPIIDKSGKRYKLAFCPERTAEGRALPELVELPQIVGGIDLESSEAANTFFRKITPTILDVYSLEAAEMIKLVNNTYRDTMFAFANEVALACEAVGLDANAVIRASNQGYPRSNVPRPGLVGGTCLKKDPYILIESCKDCSFVPNLALAGRRVNESLIKHLAHRTINELIVLGKDVSRSTVFVSGIAFKGQPETDDTRDSPSLELVHELKARGCKNIRVHDFAVSADAIRALGLTPVTLEEGMHGADALVIGTNHPGYSRTDIAALIPTMAPSPVIMDIWRVMPAASVEGSGAIYKGLGL